MRINNFISFFIALFFHLIVLIIFSFQSKTANLKATAENRISQINQSEKNHIKTFDLEKIHFTSSKKKASPQNIKEETSTLNSSSNTSFQLANLKTTSQENIQFIKYSDPHYPRIAREKGFTGIATFKFEFNSDGVITSSETISTSGYKILDEAIKKEASNWKLLTNKPGHFIRTFKFELNH